MRSKTDNGSMLSPSKEGINKKQKLLVKKFPLKTIQNKNFENLFNKDENHEPLYKGLCLTTRENKSQIINLVKDINRDHD